MLKVKSWFENRKERREVKKSEEAMDLFSGMTKGINLDSLKSKTGDMLGDLQGKIHKQVQEGKW